MSSRSPSAPPRRRLTAPERRELIEQAAMELFAERGYHGASIDEIARRAGVTPPVIYDHFDSKPALHRRLLERTRDELLAMWRENLGGAGTLEQQIARAFDAWARYVRGHPYAPRMFFRETTAIPELRAVHREIAADASAALARIVGEVPGLESPQGEDSSLALVMTSELIRGGLTELAIWWSEHPQVAREQIVAVAMNTIWIGFERVSGGERWPPRAELTLKSTPGSSSAHPHPEQQDRGS